MNPYSSPEFRRTVHIVLDREQHWVSDKTLRKLVWGGSLFLCIAFWMSVVWLACKEIWP